MKLINASCITDESITLGMRNATFGHLTDDQWDNESLTLCLTTATGASRAYAEAIDKRQMWFNIEVYDSAELGNVAIVDVPSFDAMLTEFSDMERFCILTKKAPTVTLSHYTSDHLLESIRHALCGLSRDVTYSHRLAIKRKRHTKAARRQITIIERTLACERDRRIVDSWRSRVEHEEESVRYMERRLKYKKKVLESYRKSFKSHRAALCRSTRLLTRAKEVKCD